MNDSYIPSRLNSRLRVAFYLISLSFVGNVNAQWSIKNHDRDVSQYHNQVKFLNNDVGLVVGSGPEGAENVVMKTVDGGEKWKKHLIKEDINIQDFQFVEDWVIASGYQGSGSSGRGKMIMSLDTGTTWQVYSTIQDEVYSQWFTSPDTGIIFARNGIYKTIDSGQSWTLVYQNTDLTSPIRRSFFLSDSIGFALSRQSVKKTNDGGESWSLLSDLDQFSLHGSRLSIYFISDSVGLIGSSDKILRSTDGGMNWAQSEAGILDNQHVENFDFVTPTFGFALTTQTKIPLNFGGSATSRILKTEDGGATWENFSFPGVLHSIDFINEDTGFVSGQEGLIIKTTNSDIATVPDDYPWLITSVIKTIEWSAHPNPSGGQLTFTANIPSQVEEAWLYIYDMQGRRVKRVKISDRGNSLINIQSGELEAGMYLYSLIVDGAVVGTEKMILTK